MKDWTREELTKLQEYYKDELEEAERALNDSSYPPDEQRKIDINQDIVYLLGYMMDEKSWIYKLGKSL